MDNKEFGFLMESRTKKFAISIIRLSASLPSSSEGRVLKNQVTKSGTSIGANYREANCSKSSADFIYKIKICQSETNETLYWLEIISEIQMIESEKLQSLIIEAKELLAIFTSVIAKLKQNKT